MTRWYTADGRRRRAADGLTVEDCDAAYRQGKAELAEADKDVLTGMPEEQADWDGDPEVVER